jgi:hypothetical protein
MPHAASEVSRAWRILGGYQFNKYFAAESVVAVVATATIPVELAAKLAARELLRVNVHVGVAGADRGDDFRQLPGRDSLAGRADDVGAGDDAADRAERPGAACYSSWSRYTLER